MVLVTVMKTVKAAKQIAAYAATVMPAMYRIVPITIAVQKAGLVMVLKTVKTRLMAVT